MIAKFSRQNNILNTYSSGYKISCSFFNCVIGVIDFEYHLLIMWGHRPQMPSTTRPYWAQWESHYGPMQRRPASRRHQETAMFAPTMGYRPLARPTFPAMPNVPTPANVVSEKPVQEASLYYDFNGG